MRGIFLRLHLYNEFLRHPVTLRFVPFSICVEFFCDSIYITIFLRHPVTLRFVPFSICVEFFCDSIYITIFCVILLRRFAAFCPFLDMRGIFCDSIYITIFCVNLLRRFAAFCPFLDMRGIFLRLHLCNEFLRHPVTLRFVPFSICVEFFCDSIYVTIFLRHPVTLRFVPFSICVEFFCVSIYITIFCVILLRCVLSLSRYAWNFFATQFM